MTQKFLKYHPAEIIEKEPNQIFDEFKSCQCCFTFLLPEFFSDSDFSECIYCHKKNKNSESVRLFTFKNIFFFLSKFGVENKILSRLEQKQIKLLMKEEAFDYAEQNMIWYFDPSKTTKEVTKKLVETCYEIFIKLEIFDKCVWNIHMENLRANLLTKASPESVIMPKFYNSNPYFETSACKFLNRSHIFS